MQTHCKYCWRHPERLGWWMSWWSCRVLVQLWWKWCSPPPLYTLRYNDELFSTVSSGFYTRFFSQWKHWPVSVPIIHAFMLVCLVFVWGSRTWTLHHQLSFYRTDWSQRVYLYLLSSKEQNRHLAQRQGGIPLYAESLCSLYLLFPCLLSFWLMDCKKRSVCGEKRWFAISDAMM